MPVLTLPQIIQRISDGVDDPDNDAFSRAKVLDVVNAAVGHYDSIMAVNSRRMFAHFKDIAHDGTELRRVLPFLPRIVSVERTTDDPRTLQHPIIGGWSRRHTHVVRSADTPVSDVSEWYIQNNQIGTLPTVPSGNTDRVWYVLSTPPLFMTEILSITGTTLVVEDPNDGTIANENNALGSVQKMADAYNEINLIHHNSLEINTISDFVRGTVSHTITLAFTPENTWAADDAISIIPRIHPEHIDTIIYHAIKKLRSQDGEDTEEAHSLEMEAKASMLAYFNAEHDQEAEYIEIHNTDFYTL